MSLYTACRHLPGRRSPHRRLLARKTPTCLNDTIASVDPPPSLYWLGSSSLTVKRSLPLHSAQDSGDDETPDLANVLQDNGRDAATVVADEGHTVCLRSQDQPASSSAPSSLNFHAPVHTDLVLQLQVPVIRHIPGRVVRDFATTLAEAITRYTTSPNDDSLWGPRPPEIMPPSVPIQG